MGDGTVSGDDQQGFGHRQRSEQVAGGIGRRTLHRRPHPQGRHGVDGNAEDYRETPATGVRQYSKGGVAHEARTNHGAAQEVHDIPQNGVDESVVLPRLQGLEDVQAASDRQTVPGTGIREHVEPRSGRREEDPGTAGGMNGQHVRSPRACLLDIRGTHIFHFLSRLRGWEDYGRMSRE